ncbi:hypothetical protein Q4506_13595 [Colwellia sp. 4_MG-2023]|jgi:hypothetical protein|nr:MULTISPECIES: hypothetical protein [unclassified Colwellia]MDO6507979.1 hypothetical protein [Colwellia sp. 5_MG-2023]MDO6556719.1 hypothetical protein [Colwellia sp. 4_MG-2023]
MINVSFGLSLVCQNTTMLDDSLNDSFDDKGAIHTKKPDRG